MTYVTTIRQRGQVTLPNKIRSELPWLSEGSAIHIFPIDEKSFVVKPYQQELEEKVNWQKIWQMIRLTRSFKGKNGNLAAFIAKDRQSH